MGNQVEARTLADDTSLIGHRFAMSDSNAGPRFQSSQPRAPAGHDAHDTQASMSRRRLLVGSAGVTAALGVAGLTQSAVAQNNGRHGSQRSRAVAPSNSLSSRAYPVPASDTDIARDAADVPPPIGKRAPMTVRVDLETIELEGRLDSSTSFRYWTFDQKVPGPFIRVRVGDTVEVHLRNGEDSMMMHNIDLHAVTGPGGGAEATTAAPGEERAFRFKALYPGLFIYHCAVPPVAMHIANGMYGMILVEPEDGLSKVDREFYVMQGELYTDQPFGTPGLLSDSYEKILEERPEYFVFNGSVGALTTRHPMRARVGETVRVFFGVGGPNHMSSLHLVGGIFDHAYPLGDITSPPLRNIQTMSVPAGGSAVLEFKPSVPGRYAFLDHALSRAERGLAAWLDVEGDENPEIFSSSV